MAKLSYQHTISEHALTSLCGDSKPVPGAPEEFRHTLVEPGMCAPEEFRHTLVEPGRLEVTTTCRVTTLVPEIRKGTHQGS